MSELQSVVVINKSSNRNEVHYAVEVDATCAPLGPAPIRPYWRMLERGPNVTEQLSEGELRYLGVVLKSVRAGEVIFSLHAMPARLIAIRTSRGPDGQCAFSADMTIAGTPARLEHIYVQQKLLGIDYVLLTGVAADGAVVRERVSV